MAKPAKSMGTASIQSSAGAYEDWMRAALGSELVPGDLDRKHEKMGENAFVFLRATYWRWAETILDICPDVAGAPQVLAVGDLHVENYGTWRDAEGRLVWGVNDFDESAQMPYALDLIRLAASALLAGAGDVGARSTAAAILDGYVAHIGMPQPIVLDRDWQWLRQVVSVSEEARAKFWRKLQAALAEPHQESPPDRFLQVLQQAMPEAGLAFATTRRVAGAGSLGRPRWVACADWKGAPAVREAKALLPSAWTLARGTTKASLRCKEASTGPFRSLDPWYRVTGNLVVRRLSPNNRKLDSEKEKVPLLSKDMLSAMGREIANIHAASDGARDAIRTDLASRNVDWLAQCAKVAAKATETDYHAWIGT